MATASEFMFFVTQIELSVSEKKEQEGLHNTYQTIISFLPLLFSFCLSGLLKVKIKNELFDILLRCFIHKRKSSHPLQKER